MSRKSGGTIPPKRQIADANQAVAILETLHHWNCTKQNDGRRATYALTITHAGRRVTAYRATFVDAVVAALAKLRNDEPRPFMRLVTQ